MKLYINESKLENGKRFAVFDVLGRLKYTVSIEHSSFGTKLDIYDIHTKKVAKIRKRDVVSFGVFYISCVGFSCIKNKIAVITNLTSFKDFLYICGANWIFRGSLLSKNFELINVDKSVVMRHTKTDRPGKTVYELDVNEDKNELLCVCVALCVDILSVKVAKSKMKAVGAAD